MNYQPLFNGNISETLWRTASDNVLRKYAYGYDELNRLTNATYLKPDGVPVPNSYGESLSYDKNGNIKTLDRYGEFDDGVVALKIDDLDYHYEPSSNRLARVTDATNKPQRLQGRQRRDERHCRRLWLRLWQHEPRRKGIISVMYQMCW